MKTIKILVLLLAFSAVTFYSCSDDSPIKNENAAQKSIALRTVLNELKTANSIAGRNATTATPANPFCFEFVYPITVSYNNGSAVTIANLEGLLDVLSNESPSLFLEGIIFPFQVGQAGLGVTVTISTEEDFTALIHNCGFDTFNDDLEHTFCFDIVFPISIMQGGQVLVIHNSEELHNHIGNPANGVETQIVFPISVIYNNQTVIVHNLYEFYQMTNNCNSCVCTSEYAPVCVHTANGTIVEYGNLCMALCAGYTQNDLVSCNPSTECSITNLTTTVGNCHQDGTYDLTINFVYNNPPNTNFTIYDSNNNIIGTYPLTSLPLTIFNHSSAGVDNSLTVNFGINSNCSATQHWPIPDCNIPCNCPPDVFPVCVRDVNGTLIQFDNSCLAACHGYTPIMFENCNPGTSNFSTQLGSCFQMNYPVGVQYQGAIVTVNSDGELLQYYFSASGHIPALHYPVTVSFANANYTFANQAAFESQISTSCP